MTLHEDYARIRVNEAIKTGLDSQKVHRTLSKSKESKTHGRKIYKNLFHINIIKRFIQYAFNHRDQKVVQS